jgi:hypothetical protein
MLTLR